MSTAWAHQFIVVISSSVVGAVLTALDAIYPKDDGTARDPATPTRYAKPLSATGTGSPTHYLSTFPVTESIRVALDAAGLDALPGVTFWRCDSSTGLLALTNHVPSQSSVGQSFTHANALTALSLQIIQPTLDT